MAKSRRKALSFLIDQMEFAETVLSSSELGQMYTADERFKRNIDKHADGTAEFAAKAIACYCKAE